MDVYRYLLSFVLPGQWLGAIAISLGHNQVETLPDVASTIWLAAGPVVLLAAIVLAALLHGDFGNCARQ
jgi:hypothetical protein